LTGPESADACLPWLEEFASREESLLFRLDPPNEVDDDDIPPPWPPADELLELGLLAGEL